MSNDTPSPDGSRKWIGWLKKLGLAGFLFFLLKGLAWLAVFWFGGSALFQGC